MPQRFRKKPLEIKAIQLRDQDTAIAAHTWMLECGHTASGLVLMSSTEFHIDIHTLEGTMRALPEDWIIRGVQGEFYPCRPDIFEQTYEPAYQTPSDAAIAGLEFAISALGHVAMDTDEDRARHRRVVELCQRFLVAAQGKDGES